MWHTGVPGRPGSDYYPWGGELQFVNNDSNHYKFTGKERDTESGLDYFGARYYSNGLGRFITPDWAAKAAAVPYAEFADPQSLNLYSYVRNIPTVKVDADGHDGCCTTLPDPTPADWDLIDAAGAGGGGLVLVTVGLVVADVAGVVWIGHELSHPSHTAGQSNADEQTAIQQASQERAAQNGGVDPQQAPEPAAAAAGGNKRGGGRNAQKQNLDRVQSARENLAKLKGERDKLASKPNKTPADKKQLQRLDKQIKRETDRMKKSESHSQKHKGQK